MKKYKALVLGTFVFFSLIFSSTELQAIGVESINKILELESEITRLKVILRRNIDSGTALASVKIGVQRIHELEMEVMDIKHDVETMRMMKEDDENYRMWVLKGKKGQEPQEMNAERRNKRIDDRKEFHRRKYNNFFENTRTVADYDQFEFASKFWPESYERRLDRENGPGR